MGLDAAKLEIQLSHVFEIAANWGAILLLDEADVYLEQRTTANLLHNSLVSVFLRKLEYCEAILFMTSNRASEFDEAIISRIHLLLRYDSLDRDAKMALWRKFLERANTPQGKVRLSNKELERLVSSNFNGRQVCGSLCDLSSSTNMND